MINRDRLLQRFLRYISIDSTAVEDAGTYPSSPGQLEVGKLLLSELQAMGIRDAEQDQHGLVWATLEATSDPDTPVIAFNSHMDTFPLAKVADVKPQVIDSYGGGDIVLPGDPRQIIKLAENPDLNELHGKTIITTDGTSLLGGDDKAGIAVIMEVVQSLLEHPEIPHGSVRILFTCDEEIGHGTEHVKLDKLNATACYTLDGAGAGDIDVETFSADMARVTFQGIDIHTSIAKNRMVSAVRAASHFVDQLPRKRLAPEVTDQREGFLHPYAMEGSPASVTLKVLLRDFDAAGLTVQADLLQQTATAVEAEFPGLAISIEISQQYRNMAGGLAKEPRAVKFAEMAHERLGRPCQLTIIRGGTDGSQLTEKGLPTPNLSTGQHNPHSVLEWACLDEMVYAAKMLVELAQIWAGA